MFFYDEVPKNLPPSEALGFSGNLDALNEAGERYNKARQDIKNKNKDRKKAQTEGGVSVSDMQDRIKGKKNKTDDDIDTNYIQYQ